MRIYGRMLYTALRVYYRLIFWAPTSASRAISAVAELLVWLLVASCAWAPAESFAEDRRSRDLRHWRR